MKSEHLVLMASVVSPIGLIAERAAEKSKITLLNNKVVNAVLGIGMAAAGYFTDWDGTSDALESFGAGYFIGAVL